MAEEEENTNNGAEETRELNEDKPEEVEDDD